MKHAGPETKAGLWIPSTGSTDTAEQVVAPRPLPSDLTLPSSINRDLAEPRLSHSWRAQTPSARRDVVMRQ